MALARQSKVSTVMRKVGIGVAFGVAVILLLLWLAGAFEPKIESALPTAPTVAGRPLDNGTLIEVRSIRVPVVESAVGTIRAVHETAIASKLLAKVIEVNILAGQRVQPGEVLVRLDDADLQARLKQTEAAVTAARAARDQARIEHDRIATLFDKQAAAQIEFDRVRTGLSSAEAELQRAAQARQEAQTILEYATIQSPIDGIVVDKKIEVGDTAQPGQVLATIYDPTRMQLVASVRESLTLRLRVGQMIDVRLDSLDKLCQGTISEIVPEAESTSRTFAVKVTGPCPPGIYSGMFGRILIPLDEQEVLVVARSAVRRVGQLNVVEVARDNRLHRRTVELGRDYGPEVEVLSGLQAGERVALLSPWESNLGTAGHD